MPSPGISMSGILSPPGRPTTPDQKSRPNGRAPNTSLVGSRSSSSGRVLCTESWTVEFAQRLLAGPWPLPEESCRGTCNLLYVDDLVEAILLALRTDQAVAETFNVNGGERVTWHHYFSALAEALGVGRLDSKNLLAARARAWLMQPVRASAKFLLKYHHKRIMALYERYQPVKKFIRKSERLIRNAPTTAEFTLYGRSAFYVSARAGRILGYEPRFTMADGIARSVAWLRHEGYLSNGGAV